MKRYVAPLPRLPRISRRLIPRGYAGTMETAQHMKALIRAGSKDFYVRQKAIDILLERGIRPKDYRGEIKALFEWVQRNVRYTKDPFRVEVLHSARRMLELRAGDCDDMAILLGAMLQSVGHPVRLVLTGPDLLRPRLFTHVYLEAYHRGRWIALDATMPYPMGWAPRAPVRRVIPIRRRPTMLSQDTNLRGTVTDMTVPEWLRSLIRIVARERLQPRDERVRSLWNLLRERRLLQQSPWLRAGLQLIWGRGLPARPRPRAVRRLVRLLRRWGILPPPPPPAAAAAPPTLVPVPTVVARPVTRLRAVAARPLRPVSVRPVGRFAARR